MNPQELALEVTESLMLIEPEKAITKLTSLDRLGIKIAIDDFGVGYSSLSYLKDLPVHILKIDKCFLDDLLTKEKNQVILQTIIELGHRLSLKIIAEGVESKEQLQLLEAMECDYGQGYLFSRPLDLENVTALFKKSSFCESPSLTLA
jgi:EAL domain-containing protein (putative c-di-GMP-specific phosphodiesterase class I)